MAMASLSAASCSTCLQWSKEKVGHDWWAIEMQLLKCGDGWWPLDILHPASKLRATAPRNLPVITPEQWLEVSEAAMAVVDAVHQLTLPVPGQPDTEAPLVWGDARLANMLAKYYGPLQGWRVVLCDLDWAGAQGVTTYPSSMNAKLVWGWAR